MMPVPHADRDRSEAPITESTNERLGRYGQACGAYSWHRTTEHFRQTVEAVIAVADAEQAELRAEVERLQKDRDTAQEHVAYHLRDYSLNGEATGDLAVDIAAYSGRLRIRAEAAEAKVTRVEAALATLDEVAYLQIGVEKMLTVQPTGRYRAAVPPHWRDEVEQRVHPFREVLRAALEGES